MKTFFEELKKRRVYRVAIVYGLMASGAVQLGGTVLPAFNAPVWVQQVFLVALAFGFPVALILAWAFDLTPSGIQRTQSGHGLHGVRTQQMWLLGGAGLLVAGVAVAGYWLWHPWRDPRLAGSTPASDHIAEKSIAVLPFQNLSVEPANAFFTEGMQEQILTDLAKVSDLKVISRTSVASYKTDSLRNLREIGRQLGVAYILEGSVQRDAKRVRIRAELIDARTDTHLWAESYDRDLADVFALQSEISETIVDQLRAKLSPEEKAGIEEFPTRDLVAYDLYIPGTQLVNSYLDATDTAASLEQAIRFFEEAITRDPRFGLAYAYLSRAHSLLYFLDLDPTAARLARADDAGRTALRLKPDSGEAHLALAEYYFRGYRDYKDAMAELAIAEKTLPNSVPFYLLRGYVERRQGHWSESEENFRKAVDLDPRNTNAVNLLVDHYVLVRQFTKATDVYDRAIAIGLDSPILRVRRANIVYAASGELTPFRAALEAASPNLDVGGGETPMRISVALAEGDVAGARQALAQSPRSEFQEVDFTYYFPRVWFEARIARAEGDEAAAHAAFRSARAVFEDRLKVKPDDARTISALAQTDAGLGDKALALREAQHAVDLMPISRDAFDGSLVLQALATVYAWTGEPDRAIDLIRQLLKTPGYLCYGYLLHDPQWATLRGNPRFDQLLNSLAPNH
jgi:TolB-like protein/Tfp pilus assembly protein PilF